MVPNTKLITPHNVRVFVSHVHEDDGLCEPLLIALDAWGVDYWFDRTALRAGDAIAAEIHDAITTRDIFIRVCTSSMQRRPRWVKVETDIFLGLAAQDFDFGLYRKRRLISLIMDAGYRLEQLDRANKFVDAVNKLPRVWLDEMRAALHLVVTREDRTIGVSPDDPLLAAASPDPVSRSRAHTEHMDRIRTEKLDPAGRPSRAYLILASPAQATMYDLSVGPTIIHRMDMGVINLRDSAVSQVHAIVFRDPQDECTIRDGDGTNPSTNGTFVNGKRVPDSGHTLQEGDEIRVGETMLRFHRS